MEKTFAALMHGAAYGDGVTMSPVAQQFGIKFRTVAQYARSVLAKAATVLKARLEPDDRRDLWSIMTDHVKARESDAMSRSCWSCSTALACRCCLEQKLSRC